MANPVLKIALFLIILPQIFSHATAQKLSAKPVNASSVCKSSLYPDYCKWTLRQDRDVANVYEYGYFSLKRSIAQTNRFLRLVDKYLSSKEGRFTPSDIRALQDCRVLMELNLDYLTESFDTLHVGSNTTLLDARADDVQTLLSATLTNQQTCLESLASSSLDWRVKTDLPSHLSNDTKLQSVSLSLISKGWIPKKKRGGRGGGRKQSAFRHGNIPVKMSERVRKIFESVSHHRRKLFSDDQTVEISDIVIVSQDETVSNYTTIMDAVAASPKNTNGSTGYFLIYVTSGVYEEYVTINKTKKYILMIGDGINQTIITGNRSMGGNWTTFSSATFTVEGTGFVGVDMTIRNTAGAINGQAVALRNSADLTTFYSCSFEAYQDTLYVHSLRQFYRECDIYGTVDFIFGNAAVVLQNCNIIPRLPLHGQFNAITAQGRTDPNQNTGIAIIGSRIFPSDDLAASNGTTRTYLGRPWKLYSRTVFMLSDLDGFINPAGWSVWTGSFALDTLYYGEFCNTGAGSNTTKRVTWPGYHVMNATDAENYTVSGFLLGNYWLPQTGVPYYGDLYDI